MRRLLFALFLCLPAIADAQCYRCPIHPPPWGTLPSYGAYPAPTVDVGASLAAANWQTIRVEQDNLIISYGVIAHDPGLYNDDSGRLRRAFLPLATTSSLNYLYTNQRYSTTGYRWLRATFGVPVTGGAPYLGPLSDCWSAPPHIRLLLYTGDLNDEFGRWWSEPILLTPTWDTAEVYTITADLTDPTHWISVLGKAATYSAQAAAGFETAKAGAQIGVTFGTCSAGHGIGVANGEGDFMLQWYWVE